MQNYTVYFDKWTFEDMDAKTLNNLRKRLIARKPKVVWVYKKREGKNDAFVGILYHPVRSKTYLWKNKEGEKRSVSEKTGKTVVLRRE